MGTAQAVDLPSDLSREIKRQFPIGGKIQASTPCRLGEVESYGLLVESGDLRNPLRALLAHRKDKSKWRIYELSNHVSNSKGNTNNFLADFWSKAGFKGPYQIRCTTPATDVDINTQANGEYSKEFTKIDASLLHLCYQASRPYNNWACLTYDNAGDTVKISFIQLNAD